MKRNLLLTLSSAFVFVLFFAAAYADKENGKAGATGSPGEMTCNQSNCHTGVATNSQGGTLTITSDIPGWDYVPGETYTIAVTMSQPGRSLFGLGVEALFASGENGGTLIAEPGTQIKNANVGGVVRKNIVHQENAGATPDEHTFEFSWTAPPTNAGDITFYVAANAANGNGLKSGDWIYNTAQVVTSSAVGTSETAYTPPVAWSYNAAQATLNLSLNLVNPSSLFVLVYTPDGREVMALPGERINPGSDFRTYSLAHLPAGTYIAVIKGDGLDSVVAKVVR